MRTLLLLAFICKFQLARAQLVNLSVRNAPLQEVLTLLERQSGFNFIYTAEQIAHAKPVTAELKNEFFESALKHCFAEQPFQYFINDKHILIKAKPVPPDRMLRGRVINEEGEPVDGLSVSIKGTTLVTATDRSGEFQFNKAPDRAVLVLSGAEIERQEVNAGTRTFVELTIKRQTNVLDETVVIAYGTISRRLNTGSVATVSSKEIATQPVANPLAALQGRVAGLEIIQRGGVPGSGFTIQLRGKSSLSQGSEPLFIVDGIPFGSGNTALNQIGNAAAAGLSPFNFINPADIESIEVLKDADATAIFGSRGANGVILITTKKGRPGKMRVLAEYKTGFSKAGRTVEMLSLAEYLALRREAFANDGIIPTLTNAHDLFLWDTTRTTDYRKKFTGGTATTTDVLLSASGGSELTRFAISAGYHRETGLLSEGQSLRRVTLHSNLTHASVTKRFNLSFTVDYAYTHSDLLNRDLTSYINLAPHIPLYDEAGNINWYSGASPFRSLTLYNPLAEFLRKYKGDFHNYGISLNLGYEIVKGLTVRVNQGLQVRVSDENYKQPKASIDPSVNTLASADFSAANLLNWQVEPQLEYNRAGDHGKLLVLFGGTWQERTQQGKNIYGTNYTSDLMLSSSAGAGRITTTDIYNQYRYAAAFGRINYTYDDTWLMNLTARRDATSRFGPGRRFANFGAAGLGWIFSNSEFIKSTLPFISFGKWRASYGITGNDQVGDYRYMDTWTNGQAYQAVIGLQPSRLFNPDYGWETNTKWETALELGLLNNRLLFTAAYFINRSSSQLVNYTLPVQTGFTNVQQNFDAVFRNTGWEFTIEKRTVPGKLFQWTSAFNLSIIRNKLISFPGIENTSYKSLYTVGQPVTLVQTFRYLGVDPSTGIYKFSDEDGDGIIGSADRTVKIDPAPRFFGGWQNGFAWKGLRLDVFVEFKKQLGLNYISTQTTMIPGYLTFNHPKFVLDRWTKPGDIASIQRFTTNSAGAAFDAAYNYLPYSDVIYSDASFIRFKTIAINYDLPSKFLRKLHTQGCSFYLQSQNPFVITNYKGADPENQNLYVLPPLKTIVAGVRLTF